MTPTVVRPSWLTTSLLLLTAACSADPLPVAPRAPDASLAVLDGTSPNAKQRRVRTYDDYLEDIAQRVPEFGGFVTGPDGQVAAAMTDTTKMAKLRVELEARREHGINVALIARMRGKPARYGFTQLRSWYRAAYAVLPVRELAFVDINEDAGQLQIGVRSDSLQGTLRVLLSQAGVPADAVAIIGGVEYQTVSTTLRTVFNPVPGAVEISTRNSTATTNGGLCTAGFNALTPSGQLLLITADHCTTNNRFATGDHLFQPNHVGALTGGSNFIGTEDANASFYVPYVPEPDPYEPAPPPPPCSTYYCRYADVAAFAYAGGGWPGPQLGYLARPYFGGPVDIDVAQPRIRITGGVGYGEYVGRVDKIGRTTGWSTGTVYRRCVDWSQSGVMNLCQDEGNLTVDDGDSGGPVFVYDAGTNTARIAGIIIAKYKSGFLATGGWKMVYSTYPNIESSLPYGPLQLTP